ncbi:hypothetical protein JJD41_06370 [Oxynema sp. CENA135]|uniref:hypothetical protein n=1 Tax=Oxynema sp. CENA135 TaxID=984206 RepID=UPI00190AABA1|nr:hypothetical protein [Oxynema sp. CENA135]MBK4729490.1 hypothetical protein [Oxynema sp. CENA135]
MSIEAVMSYFSGTLLILNVHPQITAFEASTVRRSPNLTLAVELTCTFAIVPHQRTREKKWNGT